MFKLKVEDTFSAAHFLCDYNGPCENLHGHTWKIELTVEGTKLDKAGMLIDFKDLKAAMKKYRDQLDHKLLNDILDFSPTSERLSKYFYESIKKELPEHVSLVNVCIWESPTACATYSED